VQAVLAYRTQQQQQQQQWLTQAASERATDSQCSARIIS